MTTSPSKDKDRLSLDPDYAPTAFAFYDFEVQALWRIIQHQYISYEDTEALAVGTKIRKIVDGLASGPSKSA